MRDKRAEQGKSMLNATSPDCVCGQPAYYHVRSQRKLLGPYCLECLPHPGDARTVALAVAELGDGAGRLVVRAYSAGAVQVLLAAVSAFLGGNGRSGHA